MHAEIAGGILFVAELYTTCPGGRVLVVTRFNVTFLPLTLCYVNTSTCFSKDAENRPAST